MLHGRMPRAAFLRRVALACLLACAWPLSAAELGPEMTPEQVAAESYARMRAGDWAGAAETFDPAALKQFRGMFGAGGGETSPMAPMLQALLGMADGKSLDALDDRAFFAGFLKAMMGRMGGVVALRGQEILGGVPEGGDRIHLVARTRAEAMAPDDDEHGGRHPEQDQPRLAPRPQRRDGGHGDPVPQGGGRRKDRTGIAGTAPVTGVRVG